MSKSKDIGVALTARLRGITIANGYLTDIGAKVFRGRRRIDASELPCSVIIEGADRVEDQVLRQVKVAQRYIFEGHAACDADNPNDMAHDIITDIKRAIFGGDRTLGARVQRIEYVGRSIGSREDGLALIFASVEVDACYAEELVAP